MDPNATLEGLRVLMGMVARRDVADFSREDLEDCVEQFAELSSALDDWLSKGGFLPAPWVR